MTQPPSQRPAPPFTLVRALAVVTALIGAVMVVLALAGGGGLGSYGVLVGLFFIAAGLMRLRLIQARARAQSQREAER